MFARTTAATTASGIGSHHRKQFSSSSSGLLDRSSLSAAATSGRRRTSSSSQFCNRTPAINPATDRRFRFKSARRRQQLRVTADDAVNAGDANEESNESGDAKEYDVPSEEDPLPWSTPAAQVEDAAAASNSATNEEKPKILSYAERVAIMKKEKEEAGGGKEGENYKREQQAKMDDEPGTMSSFNLPMQKEVFEIPAERSSPVEEEDSIMNEMKNTHVFLPISYYGILDLSPARATRATIPKAAEAMKNAQVFEGYSNTLRQSRESLIEEAVAVLSDKEARAYHDEDLRNGVLTPIDFERAPAALAMLLEAGENQKVLEYADAILTAKNRRGGDSVNSNGKRDVALTSSMATCEYAQEALYSLGKRPSYVEGSDMLELALKTLEKAPGGKSKSFAPDLKDAIYKELDDALPGVALELLAVPLDQRRGRELGLMALKKCLWAKPGADENEAQNDDAALISKADLQAQSSRFLTAYEHAAMFVEAPDHVPADPEEVYRASISHIVAGLMSGNPLLLVDADDILEQLEIAAKNTNQTSEIGDVTIERTVCLVLLGKTEAACKLLGLSSEETSNSEMATFVRENSPSGDVVEGVCALVDQWIQQVAFPLFRDSARVAPISLEQWFSNPKVTGFVDRYALSPAFAKIEGAGSAAKRALTKGSASVLSSFFPSDDVPVALKKDVTQYRVGVISRLAFTGAIVFSAMNFFGNNSSAFQNVQLPSWQRSATEKKNVNKKSTPAPKKNTNNKNNYKTTTKDKYSKYSSGGISGLKPPQFPTVPKIEVPKIEMPKISVPSISLPKPVKKPMDESTAESVVKRWQQIKAKALGSSHDSRALSNILDGPMLRQWTLRAEDVASHGWCWEYELNKLVIEKIEIYNEDEAIVEARLTELAVLKDRSKVDDDDVYESTYRARYEMRRTSDGGWKIFGGSVVY